MATCWVIGKEVELPNGHKYISPPFVVFEIEADAVAACDMVEKVSRERPGIADAAFYKLGSTNPAPAQSEKR